MVGLASSLESKLVKANESASAIGVAAVAPAAAGRHAKDTLAAAEEQQTK